MIMSYLNPCIIYFDEFTSIIYNSISIIELLVITILCSVTIGGYFFPVTLLAQVGRPDKSKRPEDRAKDAIESSNGDTGRLQEYIEIEIRDTHGRPTQAEVDYMDILHEKLEELLSQPEQK
jgi:hypothetical protein